jgi:hypothetical protein
LKALNCSEPFIVLPLTLPENTKGATGGARLFFFTLYI